MATKLTHKHTITVSFVTYVTQSIVVNYLPLLFLTFNGQFGISLEKITLLITANFLLQMVTDLASTKLIAKIGCRAGIIWANIFAVVGLFTMVFLPLLIDPFIALIIGVILSAVGSGLVEVLISPIVEACPTKNKSAMMSLAHSFYCWGTVLVIALSTLFFALIGVENWRYLTLGWAIVPIVGAILFGFVPIYNDREQEKEKGVLKAVLSSGWFWLFALLMTCSGAAEVSMGQWASAFAESALKVDKTVGDLLGPCAFALLMGVARTLFAVISKKVNLKACMIGSAVLCIISYLLIIFVDLPWVSLGACALCGFSVGIMWPGTLSIASKTLGGTTALFALLAVFGDIGCTVGPTIVGMVSAQFNDDLKKGLLCIVIFPVIMILGNIIMAKKKSGKNSPDKSFSVD